MQAVTASNPEEIQGLVFIVRAILAEVATGMQPKQNADANRGLKDYSHAHVYPTI
jgi:hypothetical protein